MKDATRALIRLVHLADPRHDLPFLWNLALEIKEAVKRLLSLPQFSDLQNMFNETPNPTATRLHYALSNIEDSIVDEVESGLRTIIAGTAVNTYMFDGAIIEAPPTAVSDIDSVLSACSARRRVHFTVQRFCSQSGGADSLGGSGQLRAFDREEQHMYIRLREGVIRSEGEFIRWVTGMGHRRSRSASLLRH